MAVILETKTPRCRVGIPHFVSATERTIMTSTNCTRVPAPAYPVPNLALTNHLSSLWNKVIVKNEMQQQQTLHQSSWNANVLLFTALSIHELCQRPAENKRFYFAQSKIKLTSWASRSTGTIILTQTWIITTLINTNLSPSQPPKTPKIPQLAELVYFSLLKPQEIYYLFTICWKNIWLHNFCWI